MIRTNVIAEVIVAASLVVGFFLNARQVAEINRQMSGLRGEVAAIGQDRSRLKAELLQFKEAQKGRNQSLDERILAEQKGVNDVDGSLREIRIEGMDKHVCEEQLLKSIAQLQDLIEKAIASLGTCADSIQQTDRVVLATVTAMVDLVGH